jgi:beta-glucosidase
MAYNIAHIYTGDNAKLSQTSAWLFEKFSLYTLWRSRKHIDFIGLNYYFSDRIYGYRIHNPNQHQSDLGWDMQPDNLQHVLEYLNETFHLPIIITENGLADATDQQRQWWLTRTIQAMHQAIDKDVELLGYMHWSLLDNFEWDKGRWPRFGLLAVDYATMERTPRPSALALARLIKRLEVGK